MEPEGRQKFILDELSRKGILSVRQFANSLGVSEMTVRRDLALLEREDKVSTFYGGVSLHPNYNRELSHEQNGNGYYSLERESLRQRAEKTRIAQKAASMIEPGDVVLLDMGTTCSMMVDYIGDDSNHIVYTYSQEVFDKCIHRKNLRTVLCGGYFHRNTRMFESPEGVAALKRASFNKAFYGSMGITANAGVSTVYSYEVLTRKTALESSQKKILLADYTKMGKAWYVEYAELSDFDILITDDKISTEHVRLLEDSGIELIIV
jgi:DeoR family deoxyribose operon repressor